MASPIEDRPPLMTITPAAAARVRAILAKADGPVAGLRVGVKNGGCAGMAYTMELAPTSTPGDIVVEDQDVRILIDPKAILFLIGARMDFQASKMSSGFTFENPNQTSACGCGESVALTPASPQAVQGRAS